jgi:hypothetical protein
MHLVYGIVAALATGLGCAGLLYLASSNSGVTRRGKITAATISGVIIFVIVLAIGGARYK